MPRELVDFALANGCTPIDNFFDRPGMVNAPFVYGWIPGDQGECCLLVAEYPRQIPAKPYRLMFKPADPKLLSGMRPSKFEWSNRPAGLSIETRTA